MNLSLKENIIRKQMRSHTLSAVPEIGELSESSSVGMWMTTELINFIY